MCSRDVVGIRWADLFAQTEIYYPSLPSVYYDLSISVNTFLHSTISDPSILTSAYKRGQRQEFLD